MSWDRDRLLMELEPYNHDKEVSSPLVDAYLEFYGLNHIKQEGVKHRLGWLRSGNFHVVLQTFECQKPKGTVFILHGYFDHAALYHHLITYLLHHGFSVAIYDLPGHGLSSGRPAAISDFSEYQDVLNKVVSTLQSSVAQPFYAVGQSTGGAVLIDHMSQPGHETFFKSVTLLAPLVRPAGWAAAKLLHRAVSPFATLWKRSFKVNSSDDRFVEFLKKLDPMQSKYLSVDWVGALKKWVPMIEGRPVKKKRLLVVQGDADATVDWRHNLGVVKRLFEEVSVVHIQGGHHHLVNESESVRQHVFNAILREFDT